jgi:hypothetical protein
MTDIPEKRFFRPDELAKEMGFCIETIRRWLRQNRVIHVHSPKEQLIPHDEFVRTVKSGPRPRPM